MKLPADLENRIEELREYRQKIGVARAPGRIEVLGNHTDYNNGLVLSATINRFIWAMGVTFDEVNIHSINYNQSTAFDSMDPDPLVSPTWKNYVRGVYWALHRRKYMVGGMKGFVYGDVPIEAGLSSSAAIEVSLVNMILFLENIEVDSRTKAMIAFESESLFCGISCGVMDQFTSQLGKPSALLKIDCGNLQTQDISLNESIRFVVVESMVSRSAGGILNERRLECLNALNQLQEADFRIRSLSDLKTSDLDDTKEILDDTLMLRVKHVVEENERVRQATAYLGTNMLEEFGKLMYESHASSRNLYEVSHRRLDYLVERSCEHRGVLGARLTGAGLGGSIIAMMKNETVPTYIKMIEQVHEAEKGEKPNVIVCEIPGGVITDTIDI